MNGINNIFVITAIVVDAYDYWVEGVGDASIQFTPRKLMGTVYQLDIELKYRRIIITSLSTF